jgi:hypothetical protein
MDLAEQILKLDIERQLKETSDANT